MDIRLIIDPPRSGACNMSSDETLLELMATTQRPTLRIYRWEQPTLSLGYFQQAKHRQLHTASQDCPWVRRSTGGGAIVHDCEWTYSFCWPAPARGSLEHFYDFFHESLAKCLSNWGVAARRCPQSLPQTPEPFLCFQRRTQGDLVLGDHKIGGSAQRRKRGAALQHGSLLWQRSTAAPELAGIVDLATGLPSFESFVNAWLDTLLEQRDAWPLETPLPSSWQRGKWTEEEEQLSREIERRRYGAKEWNLKR